MPEKRFEKKGGIEKPSRPIAANGDDSLFHFTGETSQGMLKDDEHRCMGRDRYFVVFRD